MKVNSKGQVTIPADIRHRIGLRPGDVVDISSNGIVIEITKKKDAPSRGERLITHMAGRATTTLTTDEMMALLRGEDDAA